VKSHQARYIKARKDSALQRLPRYASTILYRCVPLLQLLHRWQVQYRKLWIPPRIMREYSPYKESYISCFRDSKTSRTPRYVTFLLLFEYSLRLYMFTTALVLYILFPQHCCQSFNQKNSIHVCSTKHEVSSDKLLLASLQ
jgi:hypothetical protein